MAYNLYKQVDKVKESLEEKGYKKDIPMVVFRNEIMVMFGMKNLTAVEWIRNFDRVKLIKVDKAGRVNFV